MLKVWHKATDETDTRLRLFNDECTGSWIDLCTVDKKGKKLTTLLSFNSYYGHVLLFEAKLTRDRNSESLSPTIGDKKMYKIWHNKKKAEVRLRLQQYDDSINVTAVDQKGKKLSAGNLLSLREHEGNITVTACYCVSKNISKNLPLNKDGQLYVEE